jgi:hypothetical protein
MNRHAYYLLICALSIGFIDLSLEGYGWGGDINFIAGRALAIYQGKYGTIKSVYNRAVKTKVEEELKQARIEEEKKGRIGRTDINVIYAMKVNAVARAISELYPNTDVHVHEEGYCSWLRSLLGH